MQIITLLPIWKLLFNEPHPPKRFPRLGRRTAVTRSRPQIFISNVNILMSVALCKWIFMDIHEFIKLLLVETKHEWGSLNSDYSPPLTLADPCSHRSTPAVGFDSSRCTELQEQVLLYTKWKQIDTKLMWTHSLESSRANTRNIHSFMSHQRWVYVLARRRLAAGAIVFIDSVLEDGTKSRGMCSPSWIPFENWCMIFDLLSKTRQMWSYLSSSWVRDPA